MFWSLFKIKYPGIEPSYRGGGFEIIVLDGNRKCFASFDIIGSLLTISVWIGLGVGADFDLSNEAWGIEMLFAVFEEEFWFWIWTFFEFNCKIVE